MSKHVRPIRTSVAAGIASLSLFVAFPEGSQAAWPAPDAGVATDCFFDWAEQQYPALFSAASQSTVREGYYYRDYTETGVRLAAGSGRVWVLGRNAVDLAPGQTLQQWLTVSGCATVDATPPTVLFTSRSDGARDVVLNPTLAAGLSEPVVPLGALADSIVLTREGGARVAADVRYDEASATLFLEPRNPLQPGQNYAVRVGNLVDHAGNPLAEHRWGFRTADGDVRNTAQQNALQFALDRALWRYAIPGATLAMVGEDGQRWYSAAGVDDIATGDPIRVDRALRIGSNTKMLVSAAILRLVDAGQVELDVPASTYLADLQDAHLPSYGGSANPATVRELLNHTSGYYNFTEDAEWSDNFVNRPLTIYAPETLLQMSNDIHAQYGQFPGFPQRGTFHYSNTNYVLLGKLLERKTGLHYEDAIRVDITNRVGLAHTFAPLAGHPTMPVNGAHGYFASPTSGELIDFTVQDPSSTWSSGNLISTVDDLATWALALGRGELYSNAVRKEQLTFVDMNQHLQYGLGIVRDRRANLLGHQGGIIGYTSQSYYIPEKDAAFAVFYNRTLAMGDYSEVVTYQALRIFWPERYAWLTANPVPRAPTVAPHAVGDTFYRLPGLRRGAGLLQEY